MIITKQFFPNLEREKYFLIIELRTKLCEIFITIKRAAQEATVSHQKISTFENSQLVLYEINYF